uniref:LMBR1 domain-containing protein 2 homolog A isoform X2 n=1 Tax=Rhizophora mucronata TaxID=61149 RepID=A0A2P2M4R9_RHIMU
MACSNTFGLVTGAFLLGFGLSEIPKGLRRNADWTIRQKVLSHKIAKMAVKLDDAHQELSNAIVVAQATSNQMSKRDPLRPYMDVIDTMLAEMFRQDPSFKPQGGRLGENDMDYDTDEKSMATLRRHLRGAREAYYRYKSEYMTYVTEALEVEDAIKNYEHGSSTGWFAPNYVSYFNFPVSLNVRNCSFWTLAVSMYFHQEIYFKFQTYPHWQTGFPFGYYW